MKSKPILLSLLLGILFIQVHTQPQIELLPFSSGFSNPIDIASAGDDRLFVVQQRGLIRIVNPDGSINPTPFLNLSSVVSTSGNERGLLGLAFHPQHDENGYFFVNYTITDDSLTVISRFSIDPENPNLADSNSEKVLLTIFQPYANHNGGNILFGPDGYLYIAVGDGGSGGDPQNFAQSHLTHLGKMLRIDIDNGDPYSIPEDNPFAHTDFTLDEIWALGLRNNWRNSFDRYTGDLWIADVGQSAREEVNFQPASSPGGENYGWRCYEGNNSFNQTGCGDAEFYTFPVFEYGHQGASCSGSITGGYVYRGALYNGLFGKYITADYCRGEFYFVEQTDEGFESGSLGVFAPFQYSSFGQDNYGELYLALRGSGNIQKLVESSDCRPVAKIWDEGPLSIVEGGTLTLTAFHHPSLEYQWTKNGEELPGENAYTLEVVEYGVYKVEVTNPENSCSNLSDSVDVLVEEPTFLDSESFQNIRIYPNPANEIITIDGLAPNNDISIELYDLSGRMIKAINISSGQDNIQVETKGIEKGAYILRIIYGDKNSGHMVMIQ